MKIPSTGLRLLTSKKLKYAKLFNEDGKVTHFFIFLKVEVLIPIHKTNVIL